MVVSKCIEWCHDGKDKKGISLLQNKKKNIVIFDGLMIYILVLLNTKIYINICFINEYPHLYSLLTIHKYYKHCIQIRLFKLDRLCNDYFYLREWKRDFLIYKHIKYVDLEDVIFREEVFQFNPTDDLTGQILAILVLDNFK